MCNWMNKKIYIRASKISVIDRGTCFRVVNLVDTQVYAKRQPVKLGILSISSHNQGGLYPLLASTFVNMLTPSVD